MGSAHIVEPADADRAEVEAFVRTIYACEYGARVGRLADRLLCRRGARGEILCVTGLRLPADGFFSERYLDQPVEAALARATGRSLRRDDVYEVTTLASRSPRDLPAFIDDITTFGTRQGLSWCFFTLTRRLALLVRRRGLAPVHLADADPGRVSDPASWGRYYETEPKVYGVCGVDLLAARMKLLPPSAPAIHHANLL